MVFSINFDTVFYGKLRIIGRNNGNRRKCCRNRPLQIGFDDRLCFSDPQKANFFNLDTEGELASGLESESVVFEAIEEA